MNLNSPTSSPLNSMLQSPFLALLPADIFPTTILLKPAVLGGSISSTSDTNVFVRLLGSPDEVYDIGIVVRGVLETKEIAGATGYFNVGGTPEDNSWNSFGIAIAASLFDLLDPPTSQTYWLNAVPVGDPRASTIVVMSYSATIRAPGNSFMNLLCRAQDRFQFTEGLPMIVPRDPGTPPIVVTQPYEGQWVQIDAVHTTRL